MHFFTQSSSSFRSTCPYQRSLCHLQLVSLSAPYLPVSSLTHTWYVRHEALLLPMDHVMCYVSQNIGCCCTTVAINCTANPQLLLLLHLFYGFFSGTTWVGRYQKGETSPDLNEA